MSALEEDDDAMLGNLYDEEDDDETFELHELVFAQSIGVDLEEDFAAELVDLAVKALYTLPDGWEVDFAESDMGKIPFFYDTNTGESHWAHPFVDDCRIIVAEKRQELYDEEEEEEYEGEEDEEGEEQVIEEGNTAQPTTPADDRSVLTGFVSIDYSTAPTIATMTEPVPIIPIEGAEIKQGVAVPQTVEDPSVPLRDDDMQKVDDGSVIEHTTDDTQVASSMPSPQKKSLDVDSIVSNADYQLSMDDHTSNNANNNLEEPSLATNATFESSIAPFVEPAPELTIAAEISAEDEAEQTKIITPSKPLELQEVSNKITTPQRSPKPTGDQLTPSSRKQSFLSQDIPRFEEVVRDGKKSLDTDSVVMEAEVIQAPEDIAADETDLISISTKQTQPKEMDVQDMEESQEDPATESLLEPSSPPPAEVEETNEPSSLSETVYSLSNKASPTTNNNSDSQKLHNFATKSKAIFDDPFADFFKVDNALVAMYAESSDERSIDNPNYFQLNQSMDIDKLLASKIKAEEEIIAKKERERRKEIARQERALRKEEERKVKLQQQEAARLLQQQQEESKREKEAAEEAVRQREAEEAASQLSPSASRRNNNLDDDANSIGSSLTNATNFASIDSSIYVRSIDSRNNMDLFSTTIDEGKIHGDNDDLVTGNLTRSLNIFDDERFQNAKPVVPLDKTVDIKVHFLSMFRSETNSQEGENMDGLGSSDRNPSPGRMKLFGGKPRTLAKINKDHGASGGSNVTVKLRKKKSPKKGSNKNGGANSSGSKWFVLEAYSSYKEADLAIRLFERMHPTTSQVNQAFPIVAKTLPPLDPALFNRFQQQGDDTMGLSALNQTNGDMLAAPSSMNSQKDLSMLLRDGVDKKTINMTIGKELPKLRIARDLSRMQWLVECNDPSAKKVFQNRIGKRLPAPLVRGNSMAGNPSLMESGPIPEDGVSGIGKSMDGIAFTASFNPQSMMSSSNSKHVSSAVPVVYSGPDIASQNNRNSARKINSTGRFSMLPQPSSTQNLNITGLPPGISPEIVSKFPSLVDRSIGPKSFRTILQNPNSPTE